MQGWGSNNGRNEVENERGKGPGTKQRIELFPSPPRPAKKGLNDDEDSSTRNDRRDKPPHIHSPPSLASRLGPTVLESTIPPQSNSEGQTGRDLPPHMVGRKLSIKGAAASKAPTNQPGMSLREKLVKAKAEAAEVKVNPSNQSETVQSISGDAVESGLELKTAEQHAASKLSLRERLERAKVEAKSKAQPGGSPHNNANSVDHCSVTHPPPTLPPEASSLSSLSNAQPSSINQDANVQILRAKLQSRLKSQRERSLTGGPVEDAHSAAGSASASTSAIAVENNEAKDPKEIKGKDVETTMDKALRKVTEEERKKELRRRLMVAKMKEAETDAERRASERERER